MKFTKILPAVILVLATFASYGQSVRQEIAANPDKAGGMYYVYTYDNPARTAVPKGYKPFYISHYGRHGSRWLLYDKDYSEMAGIFADAYAADALTSKGREVASMVKMVYDDGIGRAGSLSRLGGQQHHEIAERMFDAYPEVFRGNATIDARSTTIVRCVVSMSAFCERLKELNPRLQVSREANGRTTSYLEFFYEAVNSIDSAYIKFRHAGWWMDDMKKTLSEHLDTGRIMSTLFKDGELSRSQDATKIAWGLFFFAVSMQDVELGISFYDLFTPDELYWMSVYENYRCYVLRGPSPVNGGFTLYYAKSLLEEILESADSALAGGEVACDLRFGHDVNLMAVIPLMQLDGWAAVDTDPKVIAEKWPLYKITPMAANLQMVFYRSKKSDEVLVKFLYNEREARIPIPSASGPYYRWDDVHAFYRGVIDSLEYPSIAPQR